MFTLCSNSKVLLLQEKFSFGDVKRFDTLIYKFALVSVGNKPLSIVNAKGSCECTTINWSLTPIFKGDTAHIEIEYVPEKMGYSTKTIVVETNANPPFSVLSIDANVIDFER